MSELARSPKQIGNTIRRTRRRLGLSQAVLGERSGLRQATVSLIETGNPSMRIDTLLAILSALDLELQIASRTKASSHDIEDLFG